MPTLLVVLIGYFYLCFVTATNMKAMWYYKCLAFLAMYTVYILRCCNGVINFHGSAKNEEARNVGIVVKVSNILLVVAI